MIIQAYEDDLASLLQDSNQIKADCNAKRILWRKKFAATRKWQDAVRRAHVLKYQQQLDGAIDAYEAEMANAEEELSGLLEMIGQTRIRDNKVKLTLFMKKMSGGGGWGKGEGKGKGK